MSRAPISPELRELIAARARYYCCYCLTQEEVVGMRFTVDHIIAESLSGQTVAENLCLACWDCNLLKNKRIAALDPDTGNMVALFHPNQQLWHEHFAWAEQGAMLIGITPSGRVTVETLRLNRPLLVQARNRWIQAGWHPPQF
jgi:hypothetical protein